MTAEMAVFFRRLPVAWFAVALAGCVVTPPQDHKVSPSNSSATDAESPWFGPDAPEFVVHPTDANSSEQAPSDDKLTVVAAEIAVFSRPLLSAVRLGTIRAGGAVRLRAEGLQPGDATGCAAGFYAVQPSGFVCAGEAVTRDASDANARLLAEYALAPRAALPATYGVGDIAPIYVRIPTAAEQAIAEPGIDKALRGSTNDLRNVKITIPDALRTSIVAPGRPKPLAPETPVVGVLENHARVAWVAEFDAPDRSWLLTPELLFVPSDKVKRAAVSGFHGVEVPINAGVAFTGNQAVPRYRKSDDGRSWSAQRQTWPPITPVLLAEPALSWSDDKYLETSESGVYIRANEVIVSHPTPPSRWGLAPDATFVEIIARTNLVLLHDGDRVTFATLASVGRVTPRGKFRIFSKHLTAPSLLELPHAPARGAETPELMRMSDTPDHPNEANAIPMYAAWWASSWGLATGGVGVALAPLDARRLFDETQPNLPDGWHSIRNEGTWVIIHD